MKNKLWYKLVFYIRNTCLYPYIYRSYWHSLFSRNKATQIFDEAYYSARPNPGAGIGHQIANWIAGFWYAKQFGLKFAHIPFSTKQWDNFLGFGNGEKSVMELKNAGYKIRKLPLFKENNRKEVELTKKIIHSYSKQKVVFIAEQDQFYRAQYEVIDDLKKKFYSASTRKNDKTTYSNNNFNIAIHVRRGDIMGNLNHPNFAIRYLSNDYFERVLKQVVDNVQTKRPIHIYLFSQGKLEDYPEFARYINMHSCLNMNAQESFLHLACADLLITSKSSFSYKPALLNNGIKICPKTFWHGYPTNSDWILVENDGIFDVNQLKYHE